MSEKMRMIEEIWIVHPSGITLFNLTKGDKIDPVLFGGFFSALNSFIQQLGEKKLKTIIMGDSKLTIFQGYKGILFISRSKKGIKNKLIISNLKFVEDMFKKEFQDIIDTWNGDTNIFSNFGDMIKEIFEDTPEQRTKDALW